MPSVRVCRVIRVPSCRLSHNSATTPQPWHLSSHPTGLHGLPVDNSNPVDNPVYFDDLRKSAFMRPMTSREMPLGQTATHSPVFVQPPKPSASICSTMALAR